MDAHLEVRGHYKLEVWRQGIRLVKEVYVVTKGFPREEQFGLCSQMRRAAVSVPSNIAEGVARMGNRELLKYLAIASGSLSELDTQLIIARELGYVPEGHEIFRNASHEARLLAGFIRSIEARR